MKIGLIRRLLRRIAAWHHRETVKDYAFAIAEHQRMLAALPGEIRRLENLRKYHVGRAATFTEARSPVNFHLGRVR